MKVTFSYLFFFLLLWALSSGQSTQPSFDILALVKLFLKKLLILFIFVFKQVPRASFSQTVISFSFAYFPFLLIYWLCFTSTFIPLVIWMSSGLSNSFKIFLVVFPFLVCIACLFFGSRFGSLVSPFFYFFHVSLPLQPHIVPLFTTSDPICWLLIVFNLIGGIMVLVLHRSCVCVPMFQLLHISSPNFN